MTKKSLIGILALAILSAGIFLGFQLKGKQVVAKESYIASEPLPTETDLKKMIGVYPPGFEPELQEAMSIYEDFYGKDQIRILNYRDYTLIVPPTKIDSITSVKASIDKMIEGQIEMTPSSIQQSKDILKIRELFGLKGEIIYDTFSGFYFDQEGNEYYVVEGRMVAKQNDGTEIRNELWDSNHPHLVEGAKPVEPRFSMDKAKVIANQFWTKILEEGETLPEFEQEENGLRAIFVYSNKGTMKEMMVIVDRLTGEIIQFYNYDKTH